jgi:hypothetical protein
MAQSPCVCNTLRMATRAVTQLYDDVLRPSGLRVTQFSILAAIARLGEAGVSQLADALAIEQTTMTRSLTLLERDARIERAPHADARVKSMRLTAAGETGAGHRAAALGPGPGHRAPRAGDDGVGRRAAAARPPASHRRRGAGGAPAAEGSANVTVGYIASGLNLIGAPESSSSSRRRR